jgi:choline/ethanolamine kinase
VLQLENSNELVVVDFEYAGYNPRGYDFANHFCEWTYDYHSEQPAAMDMTQFPTHDEQIRFLKAYLDTASKLNNPDIDEHLTPECLQTEASMWLMACHLNWGLWGLIQANQSEIDFDYFLYSMQRLNAFREEFAKWRL